MPYTYDVFISYRNLPDHSQWVQQHFHPLLHGCLENLSGKRTIFRDKASIEAGDNWNQAIRSAIGSSRIMIALLTPRYFESTWCVAEWQSFVARDFADTDSLVSEPENYVLDAADQIRLRKDDSAANFPPDLSPAQSERAKLADAADDTIVLRADGDLQRRHAQSPPVTTNLVEFLLLRKLQVMLNRQATLDELTRVTNELNEVRKKYRREPLMPPTALNFAREIHEQIQLLARK